MDEVLLHNMQKYVAEVAISASTLRNQGAEGVVAKARMLLSTVELSRFAVSSRTAFVELLDSETQHIRHQLPRGARHWGTARKALNIFLRDVLNHLYLRKHYRLGRIEPWLEVPLDKQVAGCLSRDFRSGDLPKWTGVKYLKPGDSAAYQKVAATVAADKKYRLRARVHLDLYYWRQR
jgi:hypothetical protein